MAQLSIPEIIKLGDISVPLASNYEENGSLFGKRLAATAPMTIAIVTDALRWQWESFPDTTTFLSTEVLDEIITENGNNLITAEYVNPTARGVANYLYWLCGKFALEGQFIITGVGGGTVIPIMPGSTPKPLEFEVTTSSFMVNGQSTVSIPSFIGYNLLFVRSNVPQSIIDMGGSYFSWSKVTGQFVCYPAAVSGELFQLYPFI